MEQVERTDGNASEHLPLRDAEAAIANAKATGQEGE